MLTCSQYHNWIESYLLEKYANVAFSVCCYHLRKCEKSCIYMLEKFGHQASEKQLSKLLKESVSYGYGNVMYSVLDLIDQLDCGLILSLMFKDQDCFDTFFRHLKLSERVEEFQTEIIDRIEKRSGVMLKNESCLKFFFNSKHFSFLESSTPWFQNNYKYLKLFDNLDEKWKIPKLRPFVVRMFLSLTMDEEKHSTCESILLEMSHTERKSFISTINSAPMEFKMKIMENYELCKVFGESIITHSSDEYKKPHNLIAQCLKTYPYLAKYVDLREFGFELIVRRQFNILSGLISTFKLQLIEKLAPSPRSFLVLVLRNARPLGSNSNYVGSKIKIDYKAKQEEELICLIENMFRIFPDMKLKRFNELVLKEAKNLSVKIGKAIIIHQICSSEVEEEEEDYCSSSEDEYSLNKAATIMNEINKKRIQKLPLRTSRYCYTNMYDSDEDYHDYY